MNTDRRALSRRFRSGDAADEIAQQAPEEILAGIAPDAADFPTFVHQHEGRGMNDATDRRKIVRT